MRTTYNNNYNFIIISNSFKIPLTAAHQRHCLNSEKNALAV